MSKVLLRVLHIICAVLLLSGAAHLGARSYDDIVASGYIDIAVYRDFPPYSFLEKDQPAGIDIEIGKRIAQHLNVEPRWLWLTADENLEDDLRNAIWKGHLIHRTKADLMLRVPYDARFKNAIDGYGLPKNELVHMFGPYHRESWALARDLGKTETVRNLAIFQYEKVGVEIDSLPDFFLGGALRGRIRDNVMHYPSVFAGLDVMANGGLAAVAGMRSQLEWGFSERGLDEGYDISKDGLESMQSRAWDIGMAVHTNFRQLGYAIEEAIDNLVKSGEMEQVFSNKNITYELPEVYQTELVNN